MKIDSHFIAKTLLVLFCASIAIVIIDHVRLHFNGPMYTHEMWYHDRLARINEEHKLQIQIDELKNMVLELSK